MKILKLLFLVVAMGGVLLAVVMMSKDGGIEANLAKLTDTSAEVEAPADSEEEIVVTEESEEAYIPEVTETATGLKINVTNDNPECSDGIDNDGNGVWDYGYDEGCSSAEDDSEETKALPECSDGIDNDGNGVWDYGYDSGCSSPADTKESL